MYPRTNYEMTQAQLEAILDACKPTPVMFLSDGTPMGGSPQENANTAWARLGKEMGFDHMTVQPTEKGNRFFTAVPSETESQREERLARQAEEQRQSVIATLKAEISTRQERLRNLGEGQ